MRHVQFTRMRAKAIEDRVHEWAEALGGHSLADRRLWVENAFGADGETPNAALWLEDQPYVNGVEAWSLAAASPISTDAHGFLRLWFSYRATAVRRGVGWDVAEPVPFGRPLFYFSGVGGVRVCQVLLGCALVDTCVERKAGRHPWPSAELLHFHLNVEVCQTVYGRLAAARARAGVAPATPWPIVADWLDDHDEPEMARDLRREIEQMRGFSVASAR